MPRKAKDKIENEKTTKRMPKKTAEKVAKKAPTKSIVKKDSTKVTKKAVEKNVKVASKKVVEKEPIKKTKNTPKSATKKATTKTTKKAVEKNVKVASKKVVEKESSKKTKNTPKSATKKATTKTTKKAVEKNVKVASKKIVEKEPIKKTKNTPKSATKKATTKVSKNATAKKSNVKKAIVTNVEYYDLPFSYNQTIVKILAQTPNTLFIYWDISDKDRNFYEKKYGEDFFNRTKPYLIVTNKTMNYTFEVEINDFANSWYLHINDADCEYNIELCRKFISDSYDANDSSMNYQINDYLSLASSNEMQVPNDHILFDKLGKTVFFRNVKTNILEEKDISSLSFMKKIGKVYNIYDLYKQMYKDEIEFNSAGINLPSSSSSTFK